MGILDEAIKEHLELKRQHGAADDELQQLEDEAFGPAERPGAETPGDAQSEAPTEFMTVPDAGAEPQQRQEPSVADLQEAPPAPEQSEDEAEKPEADEDREAIAEQPTQHFDVEEELAAEGRPAPSDEDLVEEELDEPRLAPVDPLANMEAVEEIEIEAAPATELDDEDEEDEFWSDQRLSEELDQALDAPLPEKEDEPSAEEPSAEPVAEEPPAAEPSPASSSTEHDVLEDTPDFLEDAPEDDDLWFEQKPPKDFDFDD
jgi:hypothetical protein